METNTYPTHTTTFIMTVVRHHSQTGKRTIVKKFAFNDYVAAKVLCDQLNAENENNCNSFSIQTIKVK